MNRILTQLPPHRLKPLALLEPETQARLNPALSAISATTAIGKVSVAARRPDRLWLQTNQTGPVLLGVQHALVSGWQATVDDKPVEIYRANYLLCGVELPGGEHKVELLFPPMSLALETAITASTWRVLAVLWCWRFYQRRLRAGKIASCARYSHP